MNQVFDTSGSELAPSKSMLGAPRRVFLGVDSDLAPAVRTGFVNLDLKPFVRHDLVSYMKNIVTKGSFTGAQASKLRGGLGWAATAAWGKCGRIGQHILTQRQYFDTSTDVEVVPLGSVPQQVFSLSLPFLPVSLPLS